MRKKVADEVLQTEVNYVNSLDILVKVRVTLFAQRHTEADEHVACGTELYSAIDGFRSAE